MSLNEQFLFDTFNMYYKKGMESYRNGSYVFAKKNILQAAEILLKLAKNSNGELQRARVERANRLIAMAKEIEEKGGNSNLFQNGAMPSQPRRQAPVHNMPNQPNDEENKEKKFISASIPELGFSDVAGLYEVKKSITTRVILPLQNPEIYSKYKKKVGGGILLYGPPGTGKTMVAKAIAHEVGAKFYSVKCSDIVSKWFGEAEKNIKELFATAREDERAIIFFDEIESLGTKRGGDSSVMNRIVPELLTQIQGFENDGKNNVLLLGATNRPWDMDSALLRSGRFDELLYVPLPDAEAREFIINKCLDTIPMEEDVTIDWLVEITEGYSGADVDEFCDKAKEDPLLKAIETEKMVNLRRVDFQNASKKVRKSVTYKDLQEFEMFKQGKL